MAGRLWYELLQVAPDNYDGRLATLVQMYNTRNESYYLLPSKQAKHIARAIIPLANYFPNMLADDFNPLNLKEFRNHVIESEDFKWCRKIINRHIDC